MIVEQYSKIAKRKLQDKQGKNNKKKELILIRGVSGSGKTRLADLIRSDRTAGQGYVSISADMYFTDQETGEYNFDPAKLPQAHDKCFDITAQSMALKIEVILVHNTFTQEWEMKKYIDLAKAHGYALTTLVVENRYESKSIHNVPDEAITRQKERFNIKL